LKDIQILHRDIILGFQGKHEGWIKAALCWTIFAKRSLSTKEVKTILATQYHAKPTKELLQRKCGSIFVFVFVKQRLIPRLVHESFHSFLTDATKCPQDFYMEKVSVHARLALDCLRLLLDDTPAAQLVRHYAVTNWCYHLKNCPSQYDAEILMNLYALFHSEKIALWIVRDILQERGISPEPDIHIEEHPLKEICGWLQLSQRKFHVLPWARTVLVKPNHGVVGTGG
jgi:hypothetical protein